ncbi:MAG: B12-binding domain-containing radical SAM protein [Bacteroidales bacterium]
MEEPKIKPKILLALPDGRIHKLKLFGDHHISFREAPLTLTTLAALVPPEINATLTVVDESVQKIPMDQSFDLVALSCLTGTSPRAYELAAHFKAKGSTVVLGGVHVSLLPDEALQHADAIVSGYGEERWPELLRDFVVGRLQKRYHGNEISLDNYSLPHTQYLKKHAYMNPHVVFASRGCKGTCDFCSVPAAGMKWNTRPVGDVIDQIRNIPAGRFAFNDVSLLEDRDYAKELFTALIPLKKSWGGLCTSRIADDDEMLDLMARSGCIFLLIGLESINRATLKTMNKGFNKPDHYRNLVSKLHSKNIVVMGCFIFGSDDDTLSVFNDTVEMINELRIDVPRYAIYTPFPGTEAFSRLSGEGRLLHTRWEHYDTQHVVFQPKHMTPAQLDEGFRQAYNKTYAVKSIFRRTTALMTRFPFSFMGNLAYRIYLRRLENEQNRIYYT